MKKLSYIITGSIVLILSCSILVLAANGSFSTESTAPDRIVFNDVSAPFSESTKFFVQDLDLRSNGVEISALDPDSTGEDLVDREDALQTALAQASTRTDDSAESIHAALVQFSDRQTPVLPDSDSSLLDIPAWLVQFDDVKVLRRGSVGAESLVTATMTVVIDARTGEWLETITYSS